LTVSVATLLVAGAETPGARGGHQPQGAGNLPRFDRVLLLEDAAATSANVSIGDLDADGNLDIVLAKGRHWPLVDRVLFGDGKGRFPAAQDLGGTADRTYSGLLADLDRDGDLDIVISNDTPDPKRVYLNDGKRRFRLAGTYGRPEWPTRNAAVADVNGDGLLDIVVANRTGGKGGANYVCPNKGRGEFGADCTAFSTESATTITPSDINGDGAVDLVVPHRDGGQSCVYLNQRGTGGLKFERVLFGPPDAAIRMAHAAHFDRNGHLDIVAIDERRGMSIYFGEGGNRFGAAVPIGDRTRRPYALVADDVNRDGAVDIVIGYVESQPAVYFNDGSGRRFQPVAFGDSQGTAYGFAIDDLDGDGLLDIAMARSEAPNVVYFASRAAGR
jgi:hypothetical protein